MRKINFDLYEFERYVRSKSTRIVDYARRQQQGQPISTAPTESTVHNLLNRRMDSKQQMRWSPTGANHLIQVRAAVLSNEFDDSFQRSLDNAGTSNKPPELRRAA